MNYKSQLRGWAIDRAIQALKDEAKSLLSVKEYADALIEYAYQCSEDFNENSAYILQLAQNDDVPLESIQRLISELTLAEEQRLVRESTRVAVKQ